MTTCDFENRRRWARRKEARTGELLTAALDLFVERGYAATRLDDVAAQAGVSKGTLYLYFTSKEELFKAVVRHTVFPVLGEAMETIELYEGSSATLFQKIVLDWWERIGNTRLSGLTKLTIAEAGNFPEVAKFYHEEVICRCADVITSVLVRGVTCGEFRSINTGNVVSIVVAQIMMMTIWKHSFCICGVEPISPESYLTCFTDLLLIGLLNKASALLL